MRLWTVHPKYLDKQGLGGLWREGLLAQKVLMGNTVGYKNHPQLDRFKEQKNPVKAVATYLHYVCDEADARGYSYGRYKLEYPKDTRLKIKETDGQLVYEWLWLMKKYKQRSRELYKKYISIPGKSVDCHPMFSIIHGEIRDWEKIND